jgi:hypothetical protein
MTIGQWTSALTQSVTHSPATLDAPAALLPVRAEREAPAVDWPRTWRRARLPGLPGDLADFLFRVLHGLLPTQDRVAERGGNRGDREPGVCRCCQPDTPDSLLHTVFGCPFTAPAAAALLACLRAAVPGLRPEDLLSLNMDLQKEEELPVTTLIATSLKAIWESCRDQRPLSPSRLRAVLQARAHTLSRTQRFQPAGDRLRLLLASLPA